MKSIVLSMSLLSSCAMLNSMEQQLHGRLTISNMTQDEVGVYFCSRDTTCKIQGTLEFDPKQTLTAYNAITNCEIMQWGSTITIWYKKRKEELIQSACISSLGQWELQEDQDKKLVMREKKEESLAKRLRISD